MKLIKKRYITLIEIMIVMFLIAIITAAVAINITGSLDEGKAFKTKAGIDKIHTVIDLYLATHPEDRDNVDTQWQGIVAKSQLVKNPGDLIKDGWGVDYQVSRAHDGEIEITSQKYNDYQAKKGGGSLFNSNNKH